MTEGPLDLALIRARVQAGERLPPEETLELLDLIARLEHQVQYAQTAKAELMNRLSAAHAAQDLLKYKRLSAELVQSPQGLLVTPTPAEPITGPVTILYR